MRIFRAISLALVRRWWRWCVALLLLGSTIGGIFWFWGSHAVHTFPFGAPVSTVAIDATDTLLAVSSGGGANGKPFTPAQQAVQVWSLDNKQLRYTLQAYPCPSGALAFHPTRAVLVVGYHNGAVVEWDMTTGRPRRELQPPQPLQPDEAKDSCTTAPTATSRSIVAIVFSPDGTRMALLWGDKNIISLLDTATGVELWHVNLQGRVVSTLVFTPDQAALVVGEYPGRITSVLNTRDGSVATTLTDGNAMFSVSRLAVNAQTGQLLVARPDMSTIDVYRIADWHLVQQVDVRTTGGSRWAFSDDHTRYARGGRANTGFFAGTPLIGEDDPQVYIGSLTEPGATTTLRGHRDFVTTLVFSHNGQWLFSGSHDGTVRWWRVN